MMFVKPDCTWEADEFGLCQKILPISGAEILEIGCGTGEMAQRFMEAGAAQVIALETDRKKYSKNLRKEKIPGLQFGFGKAEDLAFSDQRFDLVTMFKSFHHVPCENMMKALQEIRRVLRKGGLAYISEPIAEGPFNDLVSLIHNEKNERCIAYKAILNSLEKKWFNSTKQYFFISVLKYKNFDEFNSRVIIPICENKKVPNTTLNRLKDDFHKHFNHAEAIFRRQIRVDVLTK